MDARAKGRFSGPTSPQMLWLMCCLTVLACGVADGRGLNEADDGDEAARAERFAALPVPEDCGSLLRVVRDELGGLSAVVQGPRGHVTLRFRPAELVACMQDDHLALSALPTDVVRAGRRSEQYVLEVPLPPRSAPHGDDSVRVGLVHYLSNGLQGDMRSVVEGDTMRCVFVHVEQGAGFDPVQRILVGFERPQNSQDRVVLIKGGSILSRTDIVFDFPNGIFQAYERLVTDPDQQKKMP